MSSFNQLSGPVRYALIGVVIAGVFFLAKSQLGGDEVAPPPPVAAQPAPTGATGGSTAETKNVDVKGATGGTGETGATGETMSAAEKRAAVRKERRAKLVAAAKDAGMPLNVYEGLKDHKAVVIFFYNPKGQTDQHVNQAVKEMKAERGKKVLVIQEKLENKSRYQGIAKVAEITQTPGLVILYGKAGDAWQGYIDGATLNSRVGRVIQQG